MDNLVLIKIIAALTYPVGLSAILILIGALLGFFAGKRFKTFAVYLAVLILAFASNPKCAKFLAATLEAMHPQISISDLVKHDAIIVLGGGLRIPTVPAVHTQIGAGSDRLWYAVRLYRAGLADKIILTGGNVYTQPGYAGESEYASELLGEWGVPASAILVETGSRTTRQNQENTGLFLEQHNIDSALLVTSAIHMPRSLALFSKLPITITPASADVLVRKQQLPELLNWIPSASALSLSTAAMHEYYGIAVDELRDVLGK